MFNCLAANSSPEVLSHSFWTWISDSRMIFIAGLIGVFLFCVILFVSAAFVVRRRISQKRKRQNGSNAIQLQMLHAKIDQLQDSDGEEKGGPGLGDSHMIHQSTMGRRERGHIGTLLGGCSARGATMVEGRSLKEHRNPWFRRTMFESSSKSRKSCNRRQKIWQCIPNIWSNR